MTVVAVIAWALVACWWFFLDRRHYRLRHLHDTHLPVLEPRYRGPEDDEEWMDSVWGRR